MINRAVLRFAAISILEDVLFVGGAAAVGCGLWRVNHEVCLIVMGIGSIVCGLRVGRLMRPKKESR
jgi:hypothetical protein